MKLRQLVLSLLLCSAVALVARAEERVIICGAAEVFVLPLEKATPTAADRVWRWQAADSPQLPAEMHKQFRTTDDCKPYDEDRILITSSSGGVALIRRSDKACLFYASARNAHSACLLPGERVAVASSTGGDELLIFSLAKSGAKLEPLARQKFVGAHGAYWDAKRERLWALGTHELLLIELRDVSSELQIVIEEKWPLPSEGGHDLSPAREGRHLNITTETHVYRFDTEAKTFAPFAPLADQADIKSLAEHPETGRILYHQADLAAKTWWSDKLRLLDPSAVWQLPGERLYKARWDVPAAVK